MTGNLIKKIIFIILCSLSSFQTGPAMGALPEPNLSQPQTIRIVRIINPRLESITDDEFNRMLGQAKKIFKKYKGVDLDFVDCGTMSITQAVEKYAPGPVVPSSNYFKPKDEMIKALLSDQQQTYQFMKDAISPLVDASVFEQLKSRESLAHYAIDIHYTKLTTLHEIFLQDGRPLLENNSYGEFLAWTQANAAQADFDLIVTNQLLASMETESPSITASLRGGINNGFTSTSKGPYYGASVFSIFPILSKLAYFINERRADYDREMAILIAGAYMTHELGHLILHEGHPTGHKGCLMKPVPGLRYDVWYDQVIGNRPCKKLHPILDHF